MKTRILLATIVSTLVAGIAAQGAAIGQASDSNNRPLPPGFEGRISYQGNYSGTRTNAGEPTRWNRAFGASSQNYSGSISYEVTYRGAEVSATFQSDNGPGELDGRRDGATCAMTDRFTRATGSFRCDAAEFSGTISSPPARRSYTLRIGTRSTAMVSNNAAGVDAPSGLVQGHPPRGLQDFYSGKLRCASGEKTLLLRVYPDGTGTMTIYPPSMGIEFSVRLIEDSAGTIRIRPAGRLNATSYEIRRSGAFVFGADLRRASAGLYGLPSEPDCGEIAFIAHSSDVGLTPEQFNRLTEMVVKDMLLRRPNLGQNCGNGVYVAAAERCPGD